MFQVQKKPCDSCIYRPGTPMNIEALEAEIADPNMAGFFAGFRECHHAPPGSGICCHGFWQRHRDACTAGQLAQRLGLVEDVEVDICRTTPQRKKG